MDRNVIGDDKIIRRAELRELIPVSDMTIWRWERNNGFPRRLRLSAQTVAWRLSEVKAWLRSRSLDSLS